MNTRRPGRASSSHDPQGCALNTRAPGAVAASRALVIATGASPAFNPGLRWDEPSRTTKAKAPNIARTAATMLVFNHDLVSLLGRASPGGPITPATTAGNASPHQRTFLVASRA